MDDFNRKHHWEQIYQTKDLKEVSWFQPTPESSLFFIRECNVPLTAKIIDIGGGDSFLVDALLDLNYQDITVLDISEAAIERAKQRLGDRAVQVKWIVADAAAFQPAESYDFWHDRAAFHFLTEENDVSNYIKTACRHIHPGGMLLMATFSEEGPKKCSGIPVKQYSESSMTELFKNCFEKVRCQYTDHQTPFNTVQNFVFCSFKRKSSLNL